MRAEGFVTYLTLGLLAFLVGVLFATTQVVAYLASVAQANIGHQADARSFVRLQAWDMLRGLALLDYRLSSCPGCAVSASPSNPPWNGAVVDALRTLCATPGTYRSFTWLNTGRTDLPNILPRNCPLVVADTALSQRGNAFTGFPTNPRFPYRQQRLVRPLITMTTNLHLGSPQGVPITEWSWVPINITDIVSDATLVDPASRRLPVPIAWFGAPGNVFALREGSVVDVPVYATCPYNAFQQTIEFGAVRDDNFLGPFPSAVFLEPFVCAYDTNARVATQNAFLRSASSGAPDVVSRAGLSHTMRAPVNELYLGQLAPKRYWFGQSTTPIEARPFEMWGGFSLSGFASSATRPSLSDVANYFASLPATDVVSSSSPVTVYLGSDGDNQVVEVQDALGTPIFRSANYTRGVLQVNASTVTIKRHPNYPYALNGGRNGIEGYIVIRASGFFGMTISDDITMVNGSCVSVPEWTGGRAVPARCPGTQGGLLYLVANRITLERPRPAWVLNGVVLVPLSNFVGYASGGGGSGMVDLYLVGGWIGRPWDANQRPIPRMHLTSPRLSYPRGIADMPWPNAPSSSPALLRAIQVMELPK